MHVFPPAHAPTDWTTTPVSRSAIWHRRLALATCVVGWATTLACHDLNPDLTDLLDPHGGSDQSSTTPSWPTHEGSWPHDGSMSQGTEWPTAWPNDSDTAPHGSGVESNSHDDSAGNTTGSSASTTAPASDEDSSLEPLATLVLVEVLADPEGKDGAAQQPEFLEWVVLGRGEVELTNLNLTVTGWPRLQGAALGLTGERLRADQTLVLERYERAEFLPHPAVRRDEHGLRVAFAHHAALRNQGGAVAVYAPDGTIADGLIYGDGEQAPADLLAKWQAAPIEKASPGFSLTRSQPLPLGLVATGWVAMPPTLGIYSATASDETSTDDNTATTTDSLASSDLADSTERDSSTGETLNDSDATSATSSSTSDLPSLEPAPMILSQVLIDPLGVDGSATAPEWLELTHVGDESAALGDFAIAAGTWPHLDTRAQGWAELEWGPGDRVKIQRFSRTADLPEATMQRVGKQWLLAFAHSGTLRNMGGAIALLSKDKDVLDGLLYGDGQAASLPLLDRWGDAPNLPKPAQGQALCRNASSPTGVVPRQWELCDPITNE